MDRFVDIRLGELLIQAADRVGRDFPKSITPDGRVRDLAIVSQTAPGFGAACETTLRGSEWSAPLDRDGHAVSTVINYTCRFDVR